MTTARAQCPAADALDRTLRRVVRYAAQGFLPICGLSVDPERATAAPWGAYPASPRRDEDQLGSLSIADVPRLGAKGRIPWPEGNRTGGVVRVADGRHTG